MSEDRPSQKANRKRAWWRFARESLYFLGLFLLFCGPVTLAVGLFMERDAILFETDGVETDGTVTSKSRQVRVGRGSSRTYLVDYRYEVGDRTYEAKGAVPFSFWNSAREGTKVPIVYLESDPSRSETKFPRAVGDHVAGIAVLAGGGVLLLLGGILAWTGRRGINRRMRTLLEGEPRPAQVTQFLSEYGVVVYRYRDSAGQVHDDRRIVAPQGINGARSPGDRFTVYVDPRHPKRHEIDIEGLRRANDDPTPELA
jgi:hypothetical protein